jgi:Domain of unknown function (DUF222)
MVEGDEEIADRRAWLIEQRSRLDTGEATWLAELARFDTSGAWAADGQLSTLSWLMVFCRMSRSTAFEKLRVARQLTHRPQVAAALTEGRISYSAARTITRAEDPDPQVDDAFVTAAESATVADVEMIVRAYDAYRDQDRPLNEKIQARRGIRFIPVGDGLTRIDGQLTQLEAAELRSALELLINLEDRQESSAKNTADAATDVGDTQTKIATDTQSQPGPAGRDEAADQSSAEDSLFPQYRAARRPHRPSAHRHKRPTSRPSPPLQRSAAIHHPHHHPPRPTLNPPRRHPTTHLRHRTNRPRHHHHPPPPLNH